jgi:hypothetical protein
MRDAIQGKNDNKVREYRLIDEKIFNSMIKPEEENFIFDC